MENPELLLLIENEEKSGLQTNPKEITKRMRLRGKDVKLFSESLARLLKGGIPILRAIEGLKSSCGNAKLERFLTQIKEEVQQGSAFSNALENSKAVPSYFSQIVYAGEVSGAVPRVLEELGQYLEKEESLKSKIREALAYPGMILLMGLTTLGVLLQVVIPKLAVVYKDFGAELPVMTQIILGLSNLFLPALTIFFIVTAWGIFIFLKKKETFSLFIYQLPVAGKFFKLCVLVQFSRLLSLLLESGIPVLEALSLTSKTFNALFIKEDILTLKRKLQDGEGFTKGLEGIQWIDPLSKMLAASGEESGCLPASFSQIAQDTQTQLESGIQMAVKLLEPGLIVAIGLVVGFIVIGTVLPIFDISGLMK